MEEKDKKSEVNITNNFYAPIGQKIDHVDTINFRMDGDGTFHFGEVGSVVGNADAIPPALSSEAAQELLAKARDAGYLDDAFQPKVSRPQAAVLADVIAGRLGIREKWKTFEALWHRRNMRSDFNEALDQRQTLELREKLKSL